MQTSIEFYIEKIERFAKKKKERIELLLIGGLAMSFYGIPRFTLDIDAEIKCSNEIYFALLEYLKKEKVAFNISDNINAWGIVPLPKGYRKRAGTVYESKHLTIKTLEVTDFVFSKLLRGTEEDFKDIIEVIKRYQIPEEKLKARQRLIHFPRDPETLFFKRKFSHLLDLLRTRR